MALFRLITKINSLNSVEKNNYKMPNADLSNNKTVV